jgi:hypothetical protein
MQNVLQRIRGQPRTNTFHHPEKLLPEDDNEHPSERGRKPLPSGARVTHGYRAAVN